GRHGVRVGLVGVVDDGDAVLAGSDLHAVLGHRPADASAAATCWRLAPHSNATAAAHSAFDTWWSPCTASATSASPSAVCNVNRGRASASSVTGPAHTSAPAVRATLTTRADVWSAIAVTAASSTL